VSDDPERRTGMVKVWTNYFWGLLVHANVTNVG
jgi:hypothetical protein